MPAKDLYRSELFRRRRAYAEASGRPWFILSAKYGLVSPDDVIEPYDVNMAEVRREKRRKWAMGVASGLEEMLGPPSGLVLEVHAGADYRDGLRPLERAGAVLLNPLEGLRLGEQLRWYETVGKKAPGMRPTARSQTTPTPGSSPPIAPTTPATSSVLRRLARQITDGFTTGNLDLSERRGVPAIGWQGMPEVAVAAELRRSGASDEEIRLLITFTAALDRARDAGRLWFSALALWQKEPWVFHPEQVIDADLTELQDALRSSSVSQRHTIDSAVWRLIAETLVDRSTASLLHEAVFSGVGDASDLLTALGTTTPAGTPRAPMLAGPKVGPMWVRMLAYPGAAQISSIEVLPVAVDVQVRKVTEYLGLTETQGQDLERVRWAIQEAWREDVRAGGAAGPAGLANTCAALDPALWFFGKWGCSYCEFRHERRPIASVCDSCLYGRDR